MKHCVLYAYKLFPFRLDSLFMMDSLCVVNTCACKLVDKLQQGAVLRAFVTLEYISGFQ